MTDNNLQNQNQGNALANYNYGEDAGKGYEGTSKADFQIPFLGIIQAQSPLVVQGKPEFNPNARAGMLFNTATMALFDGQAGIEIIPCATQRVFCEFAQREKGGGFQGVHKPEDEMVVKAVAASTSFGKYNTPSGNNLVETFYMFCLLVNGDEILGAIILTFSSTKIKVYKSIMTLLRSVTVGKKMPPLFANRLKITTQSETNPKGTFFNFCIVPAKGSVQQSLIDPTTEAGKNMLAAAREFQTQVGSGKVHADHAKGDGGQPVTEEAPF